MRRKMVLIGAGSAVFTKGLVMDILERPAEKWHIALCDIDAAALATMEAVCRKMIAQKNADVQLSSSANRRDVLPGADYVISTIGVGGRRAWETDVFIPRRYGVWQPVGDTVGPGGISRAMRMIPQLVDIARDVAALCPDAMFLSYSNPMTMNCMAVRRATGVPVVGLCHGVKNGLQRLAKFMQVKYADIQYTACGLNHMVFLYKMRVEGEDLFPRLVQQLEATPAEGRRVGQLTAAFIKERHACLASDDRHFSEFVPGIMAEGAYYGKTLGREAFSFEGTIRHGDEEFARYQHYAEDGVALPEDFFAREAGEHEELMEMIAAMREDRAGVYYVNLPNNGAVAGLPNDVVVERPALFTASGILPMQMPDFPVDLMGHMMRYTAVYEMAVEAALTGGTALMRHAIEECTLPLGTEAIRKMTDELLTAQKEYLPQFA